MPRCRVEATENAVALGRRPSLTSTLDALKGVASLEDFSTNLGQFSDAGMKKFLQFPNLKQIKFFHTSLKNKKFQRLGLAHLAELKQLRR